jgi:hypothetical protein
MLHVPEPSNDDPAMFDTERGREYAAAALGHTADAALRATAGPAREER